MKNLSKENQAQYNFPHLRDMVDIPNRLEHNTLDFFILGDTQIQLNNIDGERLTGLVEEIAKKYNNICHKLRNFVGKVNQDSIILSNN